MRVRPGVIFASALTMFVGIFTLLGLLGGNKLAFIIPGSEPVALVISSLAQLFLQIAVTTIALTIIIGVLNLMTVHVNRLFRGRGNVFNRVNSLVLVATFVLTLTIYIIARNSDNAAAKDLNRLLLEDVQVSIESAMAGLLFFVLVYGAFRILQREVSFYRMLFVVTVLVVLVGSLPIPGLSAVATVYRWLIEVPVSAGARGILLGIALATLLTGVRVLIGQDRSYT